MHDETIDALHRLSVRDDSPAAMSRRRFLTGLVAAGGVAALAACAPPPPAPPPPPPGPPPATAPAPGLLLLVQLAGGNDGLNTVVPMDGNLGALYRGYRGGVAIPNASPLGGGLGLHPSLGYLLERARAGKLAIVQGVGYPNPSLSHFDSIATWMYGAGGGGVPTTGWIGRWLDSVNGDVFDAVNVGSSVPLHLVGATRKASTVGTSPPDFGASTSSWDQRLYGGLNAMAAAPNSRGALAGKITGSTSSMLRINRTVKPLYASPTVVDAPWNDLTAKMRIAARLFNAGLGVRVVSVTQGDYDQHDDQLGTHAMNLAALDAALRAFFAELNPGLARSTIAMTFSEFGRKAHANGSRGTDHGTASPLLVVGEQVNGGFHGSHPSLDNLDQWDDLAFTVDFRSVYATVLGSWLGADAGGILNGSFGALPLFATGPMK